MPQILKNPLALLAIAFGGGYLLRGKTGEIAPIQASNVDSLAKAVCATQLPANTSAEDMAAKVGDLLRPDFSWPPMPLATASHKAAFETIKAWIESAKAKAKSEGMPDLCAWLNSGGVTPPLPPIIGPGGIHPGPNPTPPSPSPGGGGLLIQGSTRPPGDPPHSGGGSYDSSRWNSRQSILDGFETLEYPLPVEGDTMNNLGPDGQVGGGDDLPSPAVMQFQKDYNRVSLSGILGSNAGGLKPDGYVGPKVLNGMAHAIDTLNDLGLQSWGSVVVGSSNG